MEGCLGQYGYKRVLDMVIAGGVVNRAHVSRWPSDCPGYEKGLDRLFGKGLPSKDREAALFFLFNQWKAPMGLSIGEVAMMLCWWTSPKCGGRLASDAD